MHVLFFYVSREEIFYEEDEDTDEQIVFALRQAAGAKAAKLGTLLKDRQLFKFVIETLR